MQTQTHDLGATRVDRDDWARFQILLQQEHPVRCMQVINQYSTKGPEGLDARKCRFPCPWSRCQLLYEAALLLLTIS
jgi:hypothetical protein